MEEKQSQMNTIIGMGIIFFLLYLWMHYSATPPQATEQPAATTTTTEAQNTTNNSNAAAPAQAAAPTQMPDSVQNVVLAAQFGPFAPAARGQETTEVLENDLVRITFSSKGARIKEVLLKKFNKINSDTAGNDIVTQARLLEDEKNRFEFELPVAGAAGNKVLSSDLYFSATKSGNTIQFKADAGQGRYFEQSYTLSPDNYTLNYVVGGNLQGVLTQNVLRFNWVNHLDKLEKNQTYERTMSSVYYREVEEGTDYCDCRKNDVQSLGSKPVQWFSHSNQFFNTFLLGQNFTFTDFTGETLVLTDADPDLKILKTTASIPLNNGSASMMLYSGPNEFNRLKSMGNQLQDIVPFGASFFGGINRWVIHPIFDLLSRFIGAKGIVILLLTLLVKLLVYPLTYRMVLSQAKMSALKPQLEALKKKLGDDQQAIGVETMKLYSEFKVNPLGGCLPMLFQMPIWFALYRFFPAAIEFRQESFLWATDLSSYDVALKLPFMMPGFGNHISAFTLIWVATTLWYTWYSMKQMDNSAMQNDQMKVMKVMQYFMPLMFMFFFNSFASGLTLYLCFSNLLNIGQTVATKAFLIDNDKIREQLEANRNKPKKSGGWRDKFEEAMKEQQRLQEEAKKKQGKK